MTSIAWSSGPIFRNGAVGTEQACCCNKGCSQCYQCTFPAERSESTDYSGTEPEGCGADPLGNYTSARGQTYMPFEFVPGIGFSSTLPNYVYWKDGYPNAVSACNYKVVADQLSVSCCAECTVNGVTQITFYNIFRYRYRLLAIKCPTETEPAALVDLTSQALYGDGLEGETSPPDGCGAPIGCTPWPASYYDDPTPECSEFP